VIDSTSPSTGASGPKREAGFDRAYLAFFECFNAGQFFAAHEVLEALWLPERGRAEARFYQGLIQLAGAFVHFQHDRRAPAVALLKLGRRNLAGYPARHLGLDLGRVRAQVTGWLAGAESGRQNPLADGSPRLDPPAI
jgi:predicted metal-dependent hydrolase